MTVQFDRAIEIQVGTLVLGGLDASFSVVKTTKKEPNTCELTVYNLSQDHREELAQSENPIVQIKAGYQDSVGLIFSGDVRDVSSSYEPPDWTTVLASGDGERATQLSRINKSFAKGTSLTVAIAEAAKAMGIGLGNSAKKAIEGVLLDGGTEFLNSITLSGQASKELDRLVKSAGLEWSIQDGTLQLLKPRAVLEDISVILTPKTGLIGSPTIGNDGVVHIVALMNSDLIPARQIELESKAVSGRFRAEKCSYIGSKFDREFYVKMECSEI